MNPTNNLVNPLLTDLYQLTATYAYWLSGMQDDEAVFDLFYRDCPFEGEFTIFAGLEESVKFMGSYQFTDEHIAYLRSVPALKDCDPRFFEWLKTADCSRVRLYALREGSLAFPRVPLMRVEGPLGITQLLETTLLNLTNFPSLEATNATRFRIAAGPDKTLYEFGLRRAQGPDGAMSASRASYIGGFDGTSNVLAGMRCGIPVKGTHQHAFVSSFASRKFTGIRNPMIACLDPRHAPVDFVKLVQVCHGIICKIFDLSGTNEGELAAFTAYALAFPHGFLALVDTYDTLRSGVPNFLAVAHALFLAGYKPIGIRLDSGDLAHLSRVARNMFREASEKGPLPAEFARLIIAASNDINEQTLYALKEQGHEIDVFGIGTHLVTCQKQPALGCVYKLVEINGEPCIKLSQDEEKMTIPGRKEAYRLFDATGTPVLDLLVRVGEEPPKPGVRVLCRHPFNEIKRAYVTPSRVVPLHELVWDGKLAASLPSLSEVRAYAQEQIGMLREDHLRQLNPTPYKVSVSERLYHFLHKLREQETPIAEIC